MKAIVTIRWVRHLRRSFIAAKVGFALCATLLLIGCGAIIHPPELSNLRYPVLARAAQIEGDVVLGVSFAPNGLVSNVKALSGPPMLQSTAVEVARSLNADAAVGLRESPLVISFVIIDPAPSVICGTEGDPSDDPTPAPEMLDPQHVTVYARRGCTNID